MMKCIESGVSRSEQKNELTSSNGKVADGKYQAKMGADLIQPIRPATI